MPIIRLSEHYNKEDANQLYQGAMNPHHYDHQANLYRTLIDMDVESPGVNQQSIKANAAMHLRGAFKFVLGKEVALQDVTVDDVRTLADHFMMNDRRYHPRGENIHDKNFRNVLYEISLRTTMSLSGDDRLPWRVGILDANNEPLAILPDLYVPEEPEQVEEPKAPGRFKTFLHNKFNLFKNTFAKYEDDVMKYNNYVEAKAEYDAYYEPVANIANANIEQGQKLREIIEEDFANETGMTQSYSRQLDTSFVNEVSGKSRGTTSAVEPTVSIEKAKENS